MRPLARLPLGVRAAAAASALMGGWALVAVVTLLVVLAFSPLSANGVLCVMWGSGGGV